MTLILESGDTYFYGGRQGVVDVRLKSNPVLSAVYALENVPLLYFVLSCVIVTAAVKAKLFYDARQVINNATYVRTTKKDMWKKCEDKNVDEYLARRHVLLQTTFESIGCQMISVQWDEAATFLTTHFFHMSFFVVLTYVALLITCRVS